MSLPTLIVLIAAGAAGALAALAVTLLALRDRAGTIRRVESLFRRPPRPPKTPGPNHYYKPYWS